MSVTKNRVTLSQPINQWVNESLMQPGFELFVMSPEIAIESSFLPGEFHGEPADRIIVATARVNNFILLTRDQKIVDYGAKKYVDCLEVCSDYKVSGDRTCKVEEGDRDNYDLILGI